MEAHTFHPSIQEAEPGRAWGELGLSSGFWASQDYMVNSCLKAIRGEEASAVVHTSNPALTREIKGVWGQPTLWSEFQAGRPTQWNPVLKKQTKSERRGWYLAGNSTFLVQISLTHVTDASQADSGIKPFWKCLDPQVGKTSYSCIPQLAACVQLQDVCFP